MSPTRKQAGVVVAEHADAAGHSCRDDRHAGDNGLRDHRRPAFGQGRDGQQPAPGHDRQGFVVGTGRRATRIAGSFPLLGRACSAISGDRASPRWTMRTVDSGSSSRPASGGPERVLDRPQVTDDGDLEHIRPRRIATRSAARRTDRSRAPSNGNACGKSSTVFGCRTMIRSAAFERSATDHVAIELVAVDVGPGDRDEEWPLRKPVAKSSDRIGADRPACSAISAIDDLRRQYCSITIDREVTELEEFRGPALGRDAISAMRTRRRGCDDREARRWCGDPSRIV